MNSGHPKSSSGDAEFHHSQAMRLASAGNLAEAVGHFETATRLQPNNAAWHFNCALAWQQLNQLPKAIAAYRKALSLVPDFFDAWSNLSAAFKAAGDFAAAVDAGQKAVILRPRAAGAQLNLGNALKARGDWPAAEAAYRLARTLDPANPRIQLNLANTLRELSRVPEATVLLRDTVAKHPHFAEAHRDLAFALLLAGELRAGWIENEWRWETEDLAKKRRAFSQPAWAGEDLAERRLLVYTEQGFGDAIQFVRYVPLAVQRGAKVILECQPELKRLFQSLKGIEQLVVRGEPLPEFDFHAPLLSLPRIFDTTLDRIPHDVPYLSVTRPMEAPWSGTKPGWPKVGLVWAGNPSHLNDRARSMPPEAIPLLVNVERVHFFSLQIGERSADLKRAELMGKIAGVNSQMKDFAATAAIIEQLDLVISVDTSTAHLAGALAKPIWLLLPFAPDWRWLLGRDDTPWYPTMRLFRQQQPGDWVGVAQSVRQQLQAMILDPQSGS
jgi:tetratricopeptide (TPR) repeat protein